MDEPTVYDAMWTRKERKKIATLDRRARFLEARNGGDRDEGEAAAIRWALRELDASRTPSIPTSHTKAGEPA